VHIPYIVHYPSKIPAGQVYEGRVSNLDIFSTFGALAGAEMPTDRPIDGVNILPYLTGEKEGEPDRALFTKISNYSYVLKNGWKLQMDDLQQKKWLFNLNADPTEQNNLVNQELQKAGELTALLQTFNAEQKPPIWPALLDSPIYIDKTLNEETTKEDEFIYWPN
ncbi:MAG: sulfatase/phosphatase domain-containing protein, partial [Chitinophagales bacterium]